MENNRSLWGDMQLEYFGCDCGAYEHTMLISYFPETREDASSFYIQHPINQYRTKKIPSFWTYLFWKYGCFSKWEWKNFFYTSVWERWHIAFKYFFSKELVDIDNGVFDCICLRNSDLQRLVQTLSIKHSDTPYDKNFENRLKELEKRNIIFEIENDHYRLQFAVEDLGEKIENSQYPKHIITQIQLKRKKGISKFIEAICYALGGTKKKIACNEWELNKSDIDMMSYAIVNFIKNSIKKESQS